MNQLSTPNIVLLDSDEESRRVARESLVSLGFGVLTPVDSRSAARQARIASAELTLVDLGLGALSPVPRWQRRREDVDALLTPPLDRGYAVLRPLRLAPQTARFPVVLLRDDDSEVAAPQRHAVVGYVPKPLDAAALQRAVEQALSFEPTAERAAVDGHPALPYPTSAPAPVFELLHKALRTALVIDGDSRFRHWLRGLMALHGFRVHEAGDADEGLRMATAARPWLILSEVILPGPLDGFELCRRVRGRALTGRTPFILLSERDEYQDRYQGLNAGADDFLSKRVAAREILIRIQLVLKRYADLGTRTARGAGLEGRVELVGAPGVLQMCHLGQLSGVMTVRDDGRTAEFQFRDGQIVDARVGGRHGVAAVHAFVAWTAGRFEFVPGEPLKQTPLPESFDQLLLEGCRQIDEQHRLAEAGAALSGAAAL